MENKLFTACAPEEAGLPSGAIERYVRALVNARLAMHDVLIVRGGKLCFEAYWKPFGPDFRHRLYSCSKSFVSSAVGLLIERGLLSLEDEAVSFFPDKAPKDMHPWLREMTIRDLLRMSTCYQDGASYKPADPDWERTFFTARVSHKPGQVFSYCTTATTMLCMIIRRVSGEEFMGVLRPVFDELGISKDAFCVQSPCGHEWGGSGVCLTPREFAKFADLCTHYGAYNGKQLLPERYMREATRKQIDNGIDHASPDTDEGYGYQFWPMRNGGFAMHGMGGQFALCLPDRDITLITNAYDELNNHMMVEMFSAFWRELIPNLSDAPLEKDEAAQKRLAEACEHLALPVPGGEAHSPTEARVNGKTYQMAQNDLGMKWVRFEFSENGGTFHYENASGAHALAFGLRAQAFQPFPETGYFGRRIGVPSGRGYDCYTSAAWPLENSLMIYCHIADVHLANLRMSFAFDGDTVTLISKKHAEWFLNDYVGFASGQW